MDESTLRATIDNLTLARSSLGFWMTFWTVSVIAGCAFELITVIKEYCHDRGVWRRARTQARIEAPGRPSIGWLAFDLAGVALVVIGIGGELFIEAKVAENETKLREANAKLVSFLGGEVKDTAEKLRLANERFIAIEKRAGAIDRQLDAADRRISAVGKETKGALGSAKSASELASQVHKEAAEAGLVFAAQAAKIRILPLVFNSLSEEPPAKVHIMSVDPEAVFARSLADALKSFGWNVSIDFTYFSVFPKGVTVFNKWVSRDAISSMLYMGPETGMWGPAEIGLMRDNPTMTKTEADRLVKLSMGLGARLEREPKLDDNALEIVIGR